jgi:hypothetical protein
MESHQGVISSVAGAGFACNLFMAATHGMADFSAIFSKAEQLCNLLDRRSETVKNIHRRSPALGNRSVATVGDELPLKPFIQLTPEFYSGDLEAIYSEERKEFSNGERNENSFGVCVSVCCENRIKNRVGSGGARRSNDGCHSKNRRMHGAGWAPVI